MNKKHWLKKYNLLITGDELVAWAKQRNQDADKQRAAMAHFLSCDECELDFMDAKVPADVTATPCAEYFKLVDPTDKLSMAVYPDGRFRLDRPNTTGHVGLTVPLTDKGVMNQATTDMILAFDKAVRRMREGKPLNDDDKEVLVYATLALTSQYKSGHSHVCEHANPDFTCIVCGEGF